MSWEELGLGLFPYQKLMIRGGLRFLPTLVTL